MRHALLLAALLVAGVATWSGASATGRLAERSVAASPMPSVPGLKLVVQELQGVATHVWQAAPETPERRTVLTAFTHADGYGPRLALSPDGALLAGVNLPADRSAPDTDAQLEVINLATGQRTMLLAGADLRGLPVWRLDGTAVAVRRWLDGIPSLVIASVDGAVSDPLRWPGARHLTPVGWDARGRLLAAAMTDHGFDLVAPEHGEVLAHLSEGAAREFRLSPDRQRVSFLSDLGAAGGVLHVVALEGPQGERRARALARAVFGAVWQPDGVLALSGERPGAPLRRLALNGVVEATRLAAGTSALALPVAAAPGGWLALRVLDGPEVLHPRSEGLWTTGPGGARRIEGGGPLEVVGWRTAP